MYSQSPWVFLVMLVVCHDHRLSPWFCVTAVNERTVWCNFSIWKVADVGLYKKPMLCQSNRMHDAVVSKLIAALRGSPCDSMASCLYGRLDTLQRHIARSVHKHAMEEQNLTCWNRHRPTRIICHWIRPIPVRAVVCVDYGRKNHKIRQTWHS